MSFVVGALLLTGSAIADSVQLRGLVATPGAEARTWIKDEIAMVETAGASTARADDAAYFLERALKKRGFAGARVDWSLPPPGTVVYLDIQEGTPSVLGELTVTGNAAVDQETIRTVLERGTRNRLQLPEGAPTPFVRSEIEAGRDRLLDYYRSSGHLDAAVTLTLPETISPGNVPVQVAITEGAVHQISTVTAPAFDDLRITRSITELRTTLPGTAYTRSTNDAVTATIEQAAAESGYENAIATVTSQQEPQTKEGTILHEIDITLELGARLLIENVTVNGTDQVRPSFLKGAFKKYVGEPYDPEGVDETITKLLRTGAFRSVRAEPDRSGQDDRAASEATTLEVDVSELDSRKVTVYGGYGSYEGPILGLGFRDTILFGFVQPVDFEVEWNSRGTRGELKRFDPWTFGSEWGSTISLFSGSTSHEGYQSWDSGLRIEARRDFARFHSLTLFAQAGFTDVSSDGIEESFLGDQQYGSAFIGLSYAFDNTVPGEFPRDGITLSGSGSFGTPSFGSGTTFFRTQFAAAIHQPIGPTGLSLGARAGIIVPSGDEPLPIDYRFFSGGSTTVRSYRERQLGPRDPNNFPVGGEFYSVFNVEYTVPIYAGLQLAAFADAGNLLSEADDYGINDLEFGAGLGLRYNLPIGPLRVDYGFNLDRGENEPSGALHITFGFAF